MCLGHDQSWNIPPRHHPICQFHDFTAVVATSPSSTDKAYQHSPAALQMATTSQHSFCRHSESSGSANTRQPLYHAQLRGSDQGPYDRFSRSICYIWQPLNSSPWVLQLRCPMPRTNESALLAECSEPEQLVPGFCRP